MSQLSYREVLRNRRLALLLAGDAISRTGDGMLVVALPLLVLRIHGDLDPALAIGAIGATPFVIPVILSLVFGLGRRRFRPRVVLTADCLLRAGMLVAVGLLTIAGSLPLWALGALLLAGTPLQLISNSSRRLAATELAGENGHLAVNGLLGVNQSIAAWVVGPALGGVIASQAGPGEAMLVNAATFVVLFVVTRLAVPATPAAEPGSAATTTSGWEILRQSPSTVRLFVVIFFFAFFYGPVEVALPLLVDGPLRSDGVGLSVIWTSFGVGALAGALSVTWLRRFPQTWVLVGIIGGWGASLLLVALGPTVAVSAIGFGLGGLIFGPFSAVSFSLVQAGLAKERQQPVIVLLAAASTVAMPLGLAGGGPLIAALGPRGGLVASAVLTVLLVPVAIAAFRRREPVAPVPEAAVSPATMD